MIQTLQYTIDGQLHTREPVVVQVNSEATCDGRILLPSAADVFEARVNKVKQFTGVKKYDCSTGNIYTSTMLGWTGYQSDITFTFDPSKINTPTGAIHDETYAICFRASETGIVNKRYAADVIVQISDNIKD